LRVHAAPTDHDRARGRALAAGVDDALQGINKEHLTKPLTV
jgi:hypothetical protein